MLDIIIFLLLIAAIVVTATGGYRKVVLGLRFTMTSGVRLLVWAAILAALRHWRVPRHPVLRKLRPVEVDTDQWFGQTTGQRAWHGVAVAGCAVLLTIVMTWPQTAKLGWVPDIGDPLLSTWRIAWIAHQIVRDPIHLFDANMFYPARRTLALSDATIFPGLMGAPLLWTGVPPVVAYNIVLLSTFVLSIVFTFLFVRRLVGHTGAAVVAAVIFGFYPFRFEHYSHFELQMSFWIPLALWAFHRTLERGALRDGLLTGLAIAGQTLSSMYYGLFLVTYLVPITAVLGLTRRPATGAARALAAGALVATLLVAPAAWPYLQNRAVVGERQFGEIDFYSATPKDYFAAHPSSATWGWMQLTNNPERHLFPGVLGVALAIVGLCSPFSRLRLAYAAAFALAFDLSLGLHGTLYRSLYQYVLPYRGLRVPARISILVGFSLAVFAAWAVRRITTHIPARVPAAIVPAVLSALILLEYRPSIELEPIWKQPPAIYDRLEPSAVIVELPLPRKETLAWFDTRYMYFSTFHWRRLVNGNSGFFPPSYLRFLRDMQSFPSVEGFAALKAINVDYVILHGAFMEPDAYSAMRARLDVCPEVSLVQRFTWEEREGTVYRLVRH
jgi:hypothetical protein